AVAGVLKYRDLLAVAADVAPSQSRRDPTRRPAERADLPDRAFTRAAFRTRVIDERARVRRPPRLLVIDRVTGDLEGRAAGKHPDPDLAAAINHGDKRHHLAVRGDRWRLLVADEVGQPRELDVDRAIRKLLNSRDGRVRERLFDLDPRVADIAQSPPY